MNVTSTSSQLAIQQLQNNSTPSLAANEGKSFLQTLANSVKSASLSAANEGEVQTETEPLIESKEEKRKEVREAFDKFVGETFFRELMKSMRSTVGKPAYMHGGRAEEMFQSQLDQHMIEGMAERNGNTLTNGMFERFYAEI